MNTLTQELIEQAAEIEKIAMDKLKDKWGHLYTFRYPQRPFPTNYENDLNNIKVGLYEGAKWLKERMCSEKKVEELGIVDVNFRLLLDKYIKYVMEAEGSDFIRYGKEWGTDTEFTEQEWIMLTEIATKVNGT